MSTALAVTDGMDFATLAALTGQQTGGGPSLAFLRANRANQDDKGNMLPLGAYVLANADGVEVYAAEEQTQGKRTILVPKSIIFRPFLNKFQYSVYDNETKSTTNRSIIFNDFREDAIDEKGGNRCGKVQGKAKEQLSEAQKAVQKGIKCHRLVFGLVKGYTGIDAEGNEVTIGDTPVVYKQGGSSFMYFDDMVLKPLNKVKRPMFTQEIELIAERVAHDAKGEVVGYEPRYKLDLTKSVAPTAEDYQLFSDFAEYIAMLNEGVRTKYTASVKGEPIPQDADDMKTINALDNDFDDEIPF